MSNFYFSWKACMKPWIIHKLGNFAWENCYRDITDVVVVQVIAAARITSEDEHGFGGTALVHDNEMKVTCNFTDQAISEFELKEESTSGCEFGSDLKNALVALRRYRIVPTFTSNEGDSIFTVVVYSFTLKSFTKLSAGVKDTRMAHQHYRIVKKLKELWSQWKNDRLAFVSDDSDSGSAANEVTLSQMIQFMEETEKIERQKNRENGEDKNGERGISGENEDAVEDNSQGIQRGELKEVVDNGSNKESGQENSAEAASDINNNPETDGSTSVSEDKIGDKSPAKSDCSRKMNQKTIGASFEIHLSLLDKLRCSHHEKCLHLDPSAPGDSSETAGETSLHSLKELLESIPVVHYTCIPDNAKQGLPEGLTPLDLGVPWDQDESSNERDEEPPGYISASLSPVKSCDSSQNASQSMEALQWPPGSSSLKSLQPSIEDSSEVSLEPSAEGSEHTDVREVGEKAPPAITLSADGTLNQSEVQNEDNSKTDRFGNNVDLEVANMEESAVLDKKSQTEGEKVTTDGESQESVEIMATQPFVIDEQDSSLEKPSGEKEPVGKESSGYQLPETQPFDITVLTQRSSRTNEGEPGKFPGNDETETASQKFEPVATESEEIPSSSEHNKAFLETQTPVDSPDGPLSQCFLPTSEAYSTNNVDKNPPSNKRSAETDVKQNSSCDAGISTTPENTYNSDDSLEDIFSVSLPCASPTVGFASRSTKSRGDFHKTDNAPRVSSSSGQVVPTCGDIQVREHTVERVIVLSASDKGTSHKTRRKRVSSQDSIKEVNSSSTSHQQDSDVPCSSHVSRTHQKDDDIDWSWILNSPVNTQKLDEILGEPVSPLEETSKNTSKTSNLVDGSCQKSVVTEFVEELQTLQCKCGESFSDSCDSSPRLCQSSYQNDDHLSNGSQRESSNKRLSKENQARASLALQDLHFNRPVSDFLSCYTATSETRRLTKNPSSPSKKTRKRKYRKMTTAELSIPKQKLMEDRLLKWITLNYTPKKSKKK